MKEQSPLEQLIKTKDKYLKITDGVIDYDKFNYYAIVHHSTSLEGSSLSLEETSLLLDENLTPKNKPLEHTLMNVDHLNALKYVVKLAESKAILRVGHINEISALIMKGTGSEISTIAGNYDSSKGDFRKGTVRVTARAFMDYQKVPGKVKGVVDNINAELIKSDDFYQNSLLAYKTHFDMVSIHPFADGNGRLSRLLMNYVQHYHNQPLTVVFKEDKQDYFQSLEKTREQDKPEPEVFQNFMFNQAFKYFNSEIEMLTKEQKQSRSKGLSGMSYLL